MDLLRNKVVKRQIVVRQYSYSILGGIGIIMLIAKLCDCSCRLSFHPVQFPLFISVYKKIADFSLVY